MSPKLLTLTVAAASTIAVTGFAATQAGGAGPEASAAGLKPVVIHETFTPLPCSGAPGHRTTLEQEGCAEKQILKTDTQIDLLAAQIFPILFDDRARRDFNAAQHAWLSYRKTDCLSMSDLFEGGTEAAVLDAQCFVSRNNQRVKDLRAFHRNLLRTG
ncbi:MAG: lysozyme inhibitor LprI family protein [Solirubrobacteraceae bacterium]